MADLQKQFGPSASSLAGMLPPRAAPGPQPVRDNSEVADAEVTDPVSTATTTEDRQADPAARRPVTRNPSGARASRSSRTHGSGPGRELRRAPAAVEQSQTHQTVVYVSAAAKAAAEKRRKQDRSTNAAIVLDALDEVLDDLPELLAAQQLSPRGEDSLFPSRRVPRRASSPSTRKVTFTFQATAVELQIIQDLVREFGAASLSELVAVAMEGHLLASRGGR